ncbi:unnamed protein product, partial [Lymnaea stagnalis]
NIVDTFKCPNSFRCPKTQRCISMNQVCDGIVDCLLDEADEGPHCINRACRPKKCPDKCKETIQGPLCYCGEGKEFNNTHCTDLNECNYSGFCDQKCENTDGGYRCSCAAGYDLVDKGSCQIAAKSIKPRFALANYFNVQMLNFTSEDSLAVDNYEVAGSQITTLDVDVKNNTICWVRILSQPH